ncbi:glycosyltransferase family 2 protein [Dongia sp.]|uniref:glycosyltransferase family 2 protein n=1 Tax=Dongia sp. TaxID=1977262 RepID=UPI0037538416
MESSAPHAQPEAGAQASQRSPVLSIVLPCYREAQNLPILLERLAQALGGAGIGWEVIVVDDHSPDQTFEVAAALAAKHPNVKVVRLARNSGSHVASSCGIELAQGDAAVVMASDLQDPPEILPEMIARWRAGDQVVWACRRQRSGVGPWGRFLSRVYYKLLARLVPNETLPPQGADFFLLDRKVMDALIRCQESNFSVLALILWLGFRQGQIQYDKQARLHGRSSWSFTRKIRLVIDSIISFSHLPLRLISIFGFLVAFLGFLYALYVAVGYFLASAPVEGWSSLMVVTLMLAGTQMIMLGVIGEYVWRTLHESRRRPRYNIERAVAADPQPPGPRL